MADIFLSYAREDYKVAAKLAEALQKMGWSVWWDRRITPGRSFRREIQQAIDSARCVIVLWSAASTDSDWVISEAEEGRRRDVLVPVRIEDVRIPLGFGESHTAELIGWPDADAQFGDCIAAITALAPIEQRREERDRTVEPVRPKVRRIDSDDDAPPPVRPSHDSPVLRRYSVRWAARKRSGNARSRRCTTPGR